MRIFVRPMALSLVAATSFAVISAQAQQNMAVYTDSLNNGFQDWSWNSTRNFSNTKPVHSGSSSIAVTITDSYGALYLEHQAFNASIYNNLSFWINGGAAGGQLLQVFVRTNGGGPSVLIAPLVQNSWQQYVIPFSFLGLTNISNFSSIWIQDATGSAQPTFYVDDIQLGGVPPPAVVHLSVNATKTIRTVDARWFGLNTAIWDSQLDTPQTVTLLKNMGNLALRFPGGSGSDEYHWVINKSLNNTWQWASSLANFTHVATNLGSQVMTTVNYGTGSMNEAAAWVAWANGSTANATSLGVDSVSTNWQTVGYWASIRAAAPLAQDDGMNFLRISHPSSLGFKYWEIGNEIYGASWETDTNNLPHDPYTYAVRSRNYFALMKAADPTIKVGVVLTPGEDSYANYTNHPVVNRRTGQTHNGWTPVLLATLKNLGVTPDFGIHHRYPQNPGGESDTLLLQSSSGWASDAADLRQQITDYSGASGANTELVCTENNSVSSSPGKQSTSLVDGLFLADSLGELMTTEFNGLFWWDLRNGQETDGNFRSFLYGWRSYGDYGVVNGLTDTYPTYYTAKLMQYFARPGDTVLTATSDFQSLSAYAVQRTNGDLTLLVINKMSSNSLPANISVAGFVPFPGATIYSYGIPQDQAAQTGIGSPDIEASYTLSAGTNFTFSFPPYSATVFTLEPFATPAAPQLALLPSSQQPAGQFVFQLMGQSAVPYVIQTSSNLIDWSSISTNFIMTGSLNITNTIPALPGQLFWRALWKP